jgi:hypothetical protein
VHHWDSVAEAVNARETSIFEDIGATDALVKAPTQKHYDGRNQVERMLDELSRQLERRVSYDCLTAPWCTRFHKEIDARLTVRASVIHKIRGDDLVTSSTKYLNDRAGTASRFPQAARQPLYTQQSFNRGVWGFVKVVCTLPN